MNCSWSAASASGDASGRTLAQRTVAVVGRLVTLTSAARATVTVTRPIAFGGNGFRGHRQRPVPAGWAACAPLSDQAGVRSAAATGTAARDTSHVPVIPRRWPTIPRSRARCSVSWASGPSTSSRPPRPSWWRAHAPYAQVARPSPRERGAVQRGRLAQLGRAAPLGHGVRLRVRRPLPDHLRQRRSAPADGRSRPGAAAGGGEPRGGRRLRVHRPHHRAGGIRLSGRDNRITGAVLAQGAELDGGTSIGGRHDSAILLVRRRQGAAGAARPTAHPAELGADLLSVASG